MPALMIAGCFLFTYLLSFGLSHCLSEWNRRLSWLWFRDIASR